VPEPASTASPATPRRWALVPWAASTAKWACVVLISATVGAAAVIGYQRRVPFRVAPGQVTVVTEPQGLEVTLQGKSLGKTPLTTSLPPGAYDVRVGAGAMERTITLDVGAGRSVVHRIEFAPAPQPAGAIIGGLHIQTEPARLQVLVDGVSRGLSPITLDDVQPGNHEVSVRTTSGVIKRVASVQPHKIASLIIVAPTAAPAGPGTVSAGWLTVSSPITLELREAGKLIGTSESSTLMLPAGDHDIEFQNKPLGFTTRRTIRVTTGKTAQTKIDLPNGVVSINALPWAEVWINGTRVGETPIGNLPWQIGSHEVVFRHPQLGERRETVVIGAQNPARLGVDLRKK
jgi:hypothetical protein